MRECVSEGPKDEGGSETHPAPQKLVLELDGIVTPKVALLRLSPRLSVDLESASQTLAREEAVADVEAVIVVGNLVGAAVDERRSVRFGARGRR